jgi:small subunit ribosomal protein S17e
MGRVRQRYIKRIALGVLEKHWDKTCTDFKKNREVVNKILDVEGKFIKNKIAGYITRLRVRK